MCVFVYVCMRVYMCVRVCRCVCVCVCAYKNTNFHDDDLLSLKFRRSKKLRLKFQRAKRGGGERLWSHTDTLIQTHTHTHTHTRTHAHTHIHTRNTHVNSSMWKGRSLQTKRKVLLCLKKVAFLKKAAFVTFFVRISAKETCYTVAKMHYICRSFSAKEPPIIGLFCEKWSTDIRHHMHHRHPVQVVCVCVCVCIYATFLIRGPFQPFCDCISSSETRYGVATISRLLKIIGLFRRISSLSQGSFIRETYNFKGPTTCTRPIQGVRVYWSKCTYICYFSGQRAIFADETCYA